MTSLLGRNQMERDPAFARRRVMTRIAGCDGQVTAQVVASFFIAIVWLGPLE